MKFTDIIILLGVLLCTPALQAQEHGSNENQNQNSEHELFKHHKIAVVIGHTHIPAGNPDVGRTGTVIAPSWGLDYEYWFNHKWAVGLHTDLEMISYVIDNGERTELERENPAIISVVALFKPTERVVLYMGPGIELEKHENFFVYRFGVEYEFELHGDWELAPGIFYDNKAGVYDSWSVGLAIAKKF